MTTHKVFTTIRPDDELTVDDAELADLKALGILLDTRATTPEGRYRAAERQTSGQPAEESTENEGQDAQ